MNATYSKRQVEKIMSILGNDVIPIDSYSYKVNIKPINEKKDRYALSVELLNTKISQMKEESHLENVKMKLIERIVNIDFN